MEIEIDANEIFNEMEDAINDLIRYGIEDNANDRQDIEDRVKELEEGLVATEEGLRLIAPTTIGERMEKLEHRVDSLADALHEAANRAAGI